MPHTTQVQSSSVGQIGLMSTATKNKITDTVVPLWDLEAASLEREQIPAVESFNYVNSGGESVVGNDERVRVHPKHFAPGGKYRSIVKLFLRYEKQKPDSKWPIATGWLIRPDLLVTAGHCAFDWAHGLGRLVEAKCYLGYNGQRSITDKTAHVEFRSGKRVATTLEWMTAKGNRAFDVSFIHLNAPFKDIVPFNFADTPMSGNLDLGIVGYPGDLKDPVTSEPGAHMYEMFLPTKYDLANSAWRMLEYEIDTFGGNSGSPVLRANDLVSIGVHVYGGDPNSASVIGMYGNPFLDYVAAFDLHAQKVVLPGHTSTPGVQYITVPTAKTPDVNKEVVNLSSGKFGHFTTASGFSHGTSHGKPQQGGFSQTGFQPTHGHHNGNNQHNGTHKNGLHTPPPVITYQSIPERPRSRQAQPLVPSIHHGIQDEEGFMDFLKSAVKVGGPILGKVVGTVAPMALGPFGAPVSVLANIALSAAGKLAESGVDGESGGIDDNVLPEGITERAILADAAFQAMLKMDQKALAEEGFFDDVWSITKKIAPIVSQVAPKVLGSIAGPALQLAVGALGRQETGEGLYDAHSRPHGTGNYNGDHRRNIPRPAQSHPNLANSGAEAFMARLELANAQSEEGFFDDFASFVKKGVVAAGPVLGQVAKVGLPILQSALGAEADFGESVDHEAALPGMGHVHRRAILAEAALQAAMRAPQDMLEEEGFFGFMKDAISKIAPVVKKVAPVVLKNVVPIVSGILKQNSGAESGLGWAGERPGMIRKMPSNVSLRGGNGRPAFGNNPDFWNKMQTVHNQGESQTEFGFSFGPLSVNL